MVSGGAATVSAGQTYRPTPGDLRPDAAQASHTLGISYREAQRLEAAYDEKVGHAPQNIVHVAAGIKLDGWTVKDGRQAAAPSKKKAAGKAKKA
jgi:hypothetical protein